MKYEQTVEMQLVTFTITYDGWWRHPMQFSHKCIGLDEAIEAFMQEHASAASTISEVCFYRADGQARKFSRLEIDVAIQDWYQTQPMEQSA